MTEEGDLRDYLRSFAGEGDEVEKLADAFVQYAKGGGEPSKPASSSPSASVKPSSASSSSSSKPAPVSEKKLTKAQRVEREKRERIAEKEKGRREKEEKGRRREEVARAGEEEEEERRRSAEQARAIKNSPSSSSSSSAASASASSSVPPSASLPLPPAPPKLHALTKGKCKSPCGCFGLLDGHSVLTNCLICGYILCSSEGTTFCPFCSHSIPKLRKAATPAEAHLARLLTFDREAASRTTVHDAQADYYRNAGDEWLTGEEREDAGKRAEEQRKEMHDRKPGVLDLGKILKSTGD